MVLVFFPASNIKNLNNFCFFGGRGKLNGISFFSGEQHYHLNIQILSASLALGGLIFPPSPVGEFSRPHASLGDLPPNPPLDKN